MTCLAKAPAKVVGNQFDKLTTVTNKIEALRLPVVALNKHLSTSSLSQLAWGAWITTPTSRMLAKAESVVAAVSRNHHSLYRSKHVWFALARDPLAVHPAAFRFCSIIRCMRQAFVNDRIQSLHISTWHHFVQEPEVMGTFATHYSFSAAARAVGIKQLSPTTLQLGGLEVDFLTTPKQTLHHLLKFHITQFLLQRSLHLRQRPDHDGLRQGVDIWATTAFRRTTHPHPGLRSTIKEARKWLMTRMTALGRQVSQNAFDAAWERMLCGTYPTQRRLYQAGLLSSDLCLSCKLAGHTHTLKNSNMYFMTALTYKPFGLIFGHMYGTIMLVCRLCGDIVVFCRLAPIL